MNGWRWVMLLWLALLSSSSAWATEPATTDCGDCHRERDHTLWQAWQQSAHNLPDLDCRSCHGNSHNGQMAARARRDATCTTCHQRQASSYLLSKHGVIATLAEPENRYDQPLADGNYRAPGCAYCHMHRGNHQTGREILPLLPREGCAEPTANQAERREEPCRDCHSPRLVTTWFQSGDRMVEIGRMKLREGAEVVARIATSEPAAMPQARALWQQMRDQHLANVRLGVGHQSPDDQWWHGHPALDGDLLRLKSLLR
ncbi:MAG: hypothetical protein HQM06_02095 [Magnetococcales bacterium]|nr:hypothetical protein [Magnetococcales bacterium]